MRVTVGADRLPPAADGGHGERGGVVVGADGHPAGVGGDVVDPVRDRLAQLLVREVVSLHPLRVSARPPLAAAVLVLPDEFLLLSVHADHRLPRRMMLAHLVVDIAELGVAVRVLGALDLLGRGLQAVAGVVQQPPHQPFAATDRLPDALASTVAKRMRAAYRNPDPLVAQAELEALARELDRSHPGAAASLREGLAETLTIGRLGVPPTLARTLRSTNSIESMIEICRDHAANVKRWQDGQMVLRWIAAGMGEAAKQFRRVNGYLHLPALRAALDQTIAAVTPTKEDAAA